MTEPNIIDRLRAATEEHRKECAKQPPHDICFDCEVSELFAEAAGTIASLNDKLVMQDIQIQGHNDRAKVLIEAKNYWVNQADWYRKRAYAWEKRDRALEEAAHAVLAQDLTGGSVSVSAEAFDALSDALNPPSNPDPEPNVQGPFITREKP